VKPSAPNFTTDVSITIESSSISNLSTVMGWVSPMHSHVYFDAIYRRPFPGLNPRRHPRSPCANQGIDFNVGNQIALLVNVSSVEQREGRKAVSGKTFSERKLILGVSTRFKFAEP